MVPREGKVETQRLATQEILDRRVKGKVGGD